MADAFYADAFYWIALLHRRDAWHKPAAEWQSKNLLAEIVTTEEVLIEVLNWFSARGPMGRQIAAQGVRDIIASSNTTVLPQTSADFHAALAIYEARLDKDYSLTDCRSMLAMKLLGLTEVLTNDHHFGQEGFTVVFS
jgi:predicted nucleic acid-binding protein